MKANTKDRHSLDQQYELEIQGALINGEALTEANFICNIRFLSC